MKYQDYISEWLVYGKHNKKSACDCVACRMQRELEVANPVFYTAADLKAARLETVARVEKLVRDSLDIDYYGSARGVVWDVLNRLKEELKNE